MAIPALKVVSIKEAAETLLRFSIDRDDLKFILDNLPKNAELDRVALEYEIQILKILSVGWSLAFFMVDSSLKRSLTEAFWSGVRDFSKTISLASSASLNEGYDYFALLKFRFDTYLAALNGRLETKEPVEAIAPAFSALCGDENNAVIMLSGSKMFHLAVSGVRHYLDSVTLTG